MTPKQRELLSGMGNCYAACHADFEETVEMVGSARGLKPDEVKNILARIREENSSEEDYRRLRSRLPQDFPV